MSLTINFNYNYPQVAREAGFRLRQHKDGPLDWRLLGALDMERIQRDQQLEQVDGVLNHLSEVPLASLLDSNILDSGIAKYFMLSQFAIQYLLFCRKFLDETVADLRDAYAASQMEVARLKKSHAEANNEILQLHKKITQMEAIHEVVYPCAFCTKSFISNEALNLHLGRKHPNSARALPPAVEQRQPEVAIISSAASGGEKKTTLNDLSLINTIKLELEIKQLKERLNVAEREIRERSAVNSKRTTPRNETPQATPKAIIPAATARQPIASHRSVGIQNNLIEVKERDETYALESSESEMRACGEQLDNLQAKVREFEEWRECLRSTNAESMAEINRKLGDLTQALASGGTNTAGGNLNGQLAGSQSEERRHSVGKLEKILTEKVTEIGKASAAKLEQVVYHMEMNYKEKLNELERDIKEQQRERLKEKDDLLNNRKSNETNKQRSTAERKSLQRGQTFAERAETTETTDSEEATPIVRVKRATKPEKPSEAVEGPKCPAAPAMNETFIVKTVAATAKDTPTAKKAIENELVVVSPSSSTDEESNHTFVKPAEIKVAAQEVHKSSIPEPVQAHEDTTDISESLDDEEEEDDTADSESDKVTPLPSTKETKQIPPANKPVERPKTAKIVKEAPAKKITEKNAEKKKPAKAKEFTRADAKQLLDDVLNEHGVDTKAKTVPNAVFRRSMAELAERRAQLKEKHPNFYVTRNRIKKFVDRLCTTKTADKADTLLKQKQPLQPADVDRHQQQQQQQQQAQRLILESPSLDEDFPTARSPATLRTSTPAKEAEEKDDFKQRLESILSSPMHRPMSDRHSTFPAQVRRGGEVPVRAVAAATAMPMPVPRKRVMFSTNQAAQKPEQRIYDFGQ